MDLGDEAQARAEREREAAVERVRREARGRGQETCRTCGEAIDPARRIAQPNAVRCLDCQERSERPGRMRRR